MPRVRRPPPEDRMAMREALHDDVAAGRVEWAEGLRRMRRSLGMTQDGFARAFRLTRRQVVDMEAGRANPTAETLAKVARPFGFRVGFVPRRCRGDLGREVEMLIQHIESQARLLFGEGAERVWFSNPDVQFLPDRSSVGLLVGLRDGQTMFRVDVELGHQFERCLRVHVSDDALRDALTRHPGFGYEGETFVLARWSGLTGVTPDDLAERLAWVFPPLPVVPAPGLGQRGTAMAWLVGKFVDGARRVVGGGVGRIAAALGVGGTAIPRGGLPALPDPLPSAPQIRRPLPDVEPLRRFAALVADLAEDESPAPPPGAARGRSAAAHVRGPGRRAAHAAGR